MTTVERSSPCKVNLLLNVLGRRADGFHELETVMQPVPVCDRLTFAAGGAGIRLTVNRPELPAGPENLVYRAAEAFLAATGRQTGLAIHLEKNIPLAAGLGGGSGNAAQTLLGLNELFGHPLPDAKLSELAGALGSDVPFFLQSQPALATGRGEHVRPLPNFAALRGAFLLLVHPGFGVPTPWAYRALADHPAALNGQPGRAARLIHTLQNGTLPDAAAQFYNSLEAPVLQKYPLLAVFQDFFRAHGAAGALMSGSGSTTFAVLSGRAAAEALLDQFRRHFGEHYWTAIAALPDQ